MTVLQAVRMQRGLTQTELARRSGVAQPIICAIENGRTRYPRVDTMKALANALEVTVDTLIGDDANETADSKAGG